MAGFNKKKYLTLLDNLEAVELSLSSVKTENDVFRFDSEYFQKRFLKEDVNRSKYSNVYLGSIAYITDGQHGYHEVDPKSNILHLTAKNFKNWFADDLSADPLAAWVHENNQRSALTVNDIVLTTRGTVGFCALVRDEVLPANIDQDVARIAILKEKQKTILPEYLVTYINSSYGKDWTARNCTGMVQQGLALWRVREMPVPVLNIRFQTAIKEIIDNAHGSILLSRSVYTHAERTLLSELHLLNWEPSKANTAVKRLSESFGSSQRLDAEYYQPKYYEVLDILSKSPHKKLGELVSVRKSIEPGSAYYTTEGIPFIRVSDVSKFGITPPDYHLDRSLFDIEHLKPKRDSILFSKDGTVGIAYKVENDLDAITSSALLNLEVIEGALQPDYLTLVLNSKLVQMQAERDAGGSIIQHWRIDEIKEVLIPILPASSQTKITHQVQKSFALMKESEKLLKLAKAAVELAIEQDEQTALKYLKQTQ